METINTNDTGIENLACNNSVAETGEHLELLLHAKGMKIFLRLDQAAEARAVGLTMRPMVLFLFGDPKAGTPLMKRYPSLAMDLPLKALIWESEEGKVWISYSRRVQSEARHHTGRTSGHHRPRIKSRTQGVLQTSVPPIIVSPRRDRLESKLFTILGYRDYLRNKR
jgi:uncharacterized protein (DUF302 family)